MRVTFKKSVLAAVLATAALLPCNAVLAQGLPNIGVPLGAASSPSSMPGAAIGQQGSGQGQGGGQGGAQSGAVQPTGSDGVPPQGVEGGARSGSEGGSLLEAATNSVTVEITEGVGSDVLMSSGRSTGQATGPVTTRAAVVGVGDNKTEADQEASSRLSGLYVEGAVVTEPTQDPALLGEGITHTSRIVWDSVTQREADGDIRRIYLREPLESQVGHQGEIPELPSGAKLRANGNLGEVLNAANQLAAGADDGDGAPSGDGSASTGSAATAQVADQAPGGSASSGEDDTETPDFRSPEVKEKEEEPPVVTTTTDGCEVEVDRINEVAYRHSRTLVDGQESVGCSRDGTTFAIKSTATGCSIDEDLEAMRAYPTYAFYYVNNSGARVSVSADCERVEGEVYTIYERESQCGIEEDVATRSVYRKAELGYTLKSGEFVIVQNCERLTDTPVATMEYTEDGCGTRTDPGSGAVTQLERLRYVLDGKDQTVQGCAVTETSTVWTYEIADCTVQIDEEAGLARVRHRLFENGTAAGECTAEGTVFPLKRTTSGCAVEIDQAAAKAWPTFETYYKDGQSNTVTVEDCARGGADDFYALVERGEACGLEENVAQLSVYERSELGYTLPQGNFVSVLACRRLSDTPLADMEYTEDGCGTRTDPGSGAVTQLERLRYVLDGKDQTVQGCAVTETSTVWTYEIADCTVQIDEEAGLARVRHRLFENGTAAGECTAEGTVFPLKRTTSGCAVEIDQAAAKAWPTFETYYKDGQSNTVTVEDCARGGADDFYALVERGEACGLEENVAQLSVYERSELGYTLPQGNFVSVLACRRLSDTPVATMAYTDAGCGTVTDAVSGAVTQLQRLHYVLDGSDETVSQCAITETSTVWTRTTEGCTVEIDRVSKLARVRDQLVTNDTPSGDCVRNGTVYAIERTRTGCSVDTDLDEMKAFPRFTNYYLDNNAAQQIVDECALGDSPDDFYTILTSADRCALHLDFTSMEVFEQTMMYYRLPSGTEVEVLNCHVPAEAVSVAPIETSIEGCGLFDDFGSNVSVQRQKLVYTLDDAAERNAQGCTIRDTSPRYSHASVLCGEEADTEAGTHALRYKVQIQIDGVPIDRTACLIDESSVVAMTKVTDTCQSLFSHDNANGRSFGYSRYKYERGTAAAYATQCEVDASIAFAHNTSDPVSWSLDDPNKQAKALREIYFEAYNQRVLVKSAAVLEGEPALPYTFEGTSIVDGTPEYTGCTKTLPQVEMAVYRRPDTTLMYEATGEEEAPLVSNACSEIQRPVWAYTRESTSCQNHGDWNTVTVRRYCYYRGSRLVEREDGAQITQNSANENSYVNASSASGGKTCGTGGLPSPAACSDPYSGDLSSGWNDAEGW